MSSLQQIQVTTQQIAEAISSALSMDVTIVDDSMVRIAGTGYHQATIGQKITGNSVYEKVIHHPAEYIINDVSTYKECSKCEKRTSCMELAQLCCPIIVGTKAIGVIGLIAFSPKQQMELSKKDKRLLSFVRKMAELIAVKVAEEDSLNRIVFLKNQMATVLNFIAEGIIAIDQDAKVINVNFAAEKLLKIKARDVIGFHLNEVFPGTPIPEVLRDGIGFINREVSVWNKGKHYHYMVSAKPMLGEDEVRGVVASFSAVGEWPVQQSLTQAKLTFDDIVGTSKTLIMVKGEAAQAAETSSTVLIMGESGTGKEVFARAIHYESGRGNNPFVAVNCGAIPENLLESELFGYEEGAFSGARKGGKPGRFQLANKGTLFLDEIGDMPIFLQVKLLRVLQEKTVERVGGIKSMPLDVRIIAATNRNLEKLVKAGTFREDLYYRLNVFPIELPALHERPDDIMELAKFFLEKQRKNSGKKITGFTDEAVRRMQNYNWPGNIRELENVVECAVIKTSAEVIDVDALPAKLTADTQLYLPIQPEMSNLRPSEYAERQTIVSALNAFGMCVEGKKRAAAHLGMGIATLYRKIRKYGIESN
ncbi:sigma-54 interaction domain-containing protein [Sporomusa acidovorans]|uniref:Anaerobic nitric oxide reductase transcription regulator NorR n=1 Tax=Sporomusa acidovorans (strain ATCC 49682 / DSM 3132 / Mol) TaxID=1123286 RepID=A0ABZ3JBK2_SPOA4|nr:sigma 54-interacting transcriptional regulator [Sporomusa acidovorans]OZC18604.1 formate hydrogenlyase transcriptional activator [Sporomusa acidovorans DSM 3132]SDF52053.1 Transcriptional regulator containing PAS, AAA-type ATPase, and DNA-binding Fis domains [Sporomusa acidovorans]